MGGDSDSNITTEHGVFMASNDHSLFSYDETDLKKEKSATALRTISEASQLLDVPQHVLRFWETKFPQIKPLKRNGGRRFYRPQDLDILQQIKHLLYSQGYTIKGAKKAVDEFIHARAADRNVTAQAWIAATPPANVNDNATFDEPDILTELALALAEDAPQIDLRASTAQETVIALSPVATPSAPSREALLRMRAELCDARETLRKAIAA